MPQSSPMTSTISRVPLHESNHNARCEWLNKVRIASIRLIGVFGHQQLLADFKPGLNLVHGKNGSGKTTLLHVLANLLECDLFRFCNIGFQRLFVRLLDGAEETSRTAKRGCTDYSPRLLTRDRSWPTASNGCTRARNDQHRVCRVVSRPPVYLPAFRSILEAANRARTIHAYRDSEIGREFQDIKDTEERYVKERRQRTAGRILETRTPPPPRRCYHVVGLGVCPYSPLSVARRCLPPTTR